MAFNILIYEDNDNLRVSLQAMLELDHQFESVTTFSNATTVINDIAALAPDVILMDIDMPGINGVEAVIKIRKQEINIPVIMFTVFEDDTNIFNAICAGANGYILKSNFSMIPQAIKDVMEGGAPISGSIAKKVLQLVAMQKKNPSPETAVLSPKEKEILELIVKGYSYKMIAAEIEISIETVRSHIKNIYKKLQVNNATAAVYKYSGGV